MIDTGSISKLIERRLTPTSAAALIYRSSPCRDRAHAPVNSRAPRTADTNGSAGNEAPHRKSLRSPAHTHVAKRSGMGDTSGLKLFRVDHHDRHALQPA